MAFRLLLLSAYIWALGPLSSADWADDFMALWPSDDVTTRPETNSSDWINDLGEDLRGLCDLSSADVCFTSRGRSCVVDLGMRALVKWLDSDEEENGGVTILSSLNSAALGVSDDVTTRTELNSTSVRLKGGRSRCYGVLEVRHKGKMTRLLPFNAERHWDHGPEPTVCRELDCGSAVFSNYTQGVDSPTLELSVECVKTNNNTKDCVSDELLPSSWDFVLVCSGLLERPTLSLSVTEGVSQLEARSLRVLLGSQFLVQCTVKPQFPGGSFQLLSPSGNHTLPAVNHSAHFLFNRTGHAHKGDYTCVYHLQVFDHSFTSESEGLELRLGVRDSDFIIRVLVLLLIKIVYIPMIYCYCKAKARGGARERTTPI